MTIFSQTDASKNNLENFRVLNDSLESFFIDHDAERFLNLYFKQLELINKKEVTEIDKLVFHAITTNVFGRHLELPNEAIKSGEKFKLIYNNSNESLNDKFNKTATLRGATFSILFGSYHTINGMDKET